MKALKSKLAARLLSDPKASAELRHYLHSGQVVLAGSVQAQNPVVIHIPDESGGTLRVLVARVPKAGPN